MANVYASRCATAPGVSSTWISRPVTERPVDTEQVHDDVGDLVGHTGQVGVERDGVDRDVAVLELHGEDTGEDVGRGLRCRVGAARRRGRTHSLRLWPLRRR
jgi:hypothetical protein